MDKTETIKVSESRNIHHFFCDDCGEHLSDAYEYEDGYYAEPQVFCIQHVKLKGHCCESCGNKRVDDVIKYARSKGFDI